MSISIEDQMAAVLHAYNPTCPAPECYAAALIAAHETLRHLQNGEIVLASGIKPDGGHKCGYPRTE